MYVKTKKNASGSKSVLVVAKDKSRRNRLVKTIGCGRTEGDVSRLVGKAKEYIENAKGPLLPGLDEDECEIEKFIGGLANTSIQVIGPELVFGALYDRIGYSAIDNAMFRHLVICRLFNPGSKLKTVEYLERYLHVSYSVDSSCLSIKKLRILCRKKCWSAVVVIRTASSCTTFSRTALICSSSAFREELKAVCSKYWSSR